MPNMRGRSITSLPVVESINKSRSQKDQCQNEAKRRRPERTMWETKTLSKVQYENENELEPKSIDHPNRERITPNLIEKGVTKQPCLQRG
jgi:hypothetical protein